MASTSDSGRRGSYDPNLIEQFCSVTGANEEDATRMLEVCGWNLEMAVNMHVDSDYQDNNDCSAGLSQDNVNNTAESNEGVRPPIPQTRGILVEEDISAQFGLRGRKRRPRSIFDGFRDFQAEARWHEVATGASAVANTEVFKKRRTLEDLFRPPLDLMHRGSFESARDLGQSTNRWLMVNIQDAQEFACQVLNRDVWSNPAVKSIIMEHFIFWQVYCDSAEGQRYMQFYKPVDFPYVAVLDPRTGENLIVWNKIDSVSFCDMVTTFLSEHSSPDGPFHTVKPVTSSLLDESEDQQIKAALEASLREVSAAAKFEDDDDSDIETFDSDSESPAGGNKLDKVKDADFPRSNCLNDEIDVVNCTESSESNTPEPDDKWKKFLGDKDDPVTELVLRLPDGKREQITWPYTSKIEALILFVESLGYNQMEYELVTNFPRRNLCHLQLSETLKEAGLFPREMIFVQLRNS